MTSEDPSQKPSETEGSERLTDELGGRTNPKVPDSNNITSKPPRDWYEYTMLIVQSLGVIFLIAYTTFAALMWCEMRKTNKLTGDALELNRKLIKGSYAAVIVADIGFDGKSASVNVVFVNRGKMITTTTANYEITQESLPDQKALYPAIRRTDIKNFFVRENEGPNHYEHLDTFAKRDFELYKNSREIIRVSGNFQYDDGFGETVIEPFCLISRAYAQAFRCEDIVHELSMFSH